MAAERGRGQCWTPLIQANAPGKPTRAAAAAAYFFGKFAIKFWDDSADRQVKILDLHLADRSR
jgi:hypothetical protein